MPETSDEAPLRPGQLWRRLSDDRRLLAAEAFWADEEARDQQAQAVTLLARQMNFRVTKMKSLKRDRKVRYLALSRNLPDDLAGQTLVAYHLQHQRAMMASFLDAVGIAHDRGLITEEKLEAPDKEKVREAARQLGASYPPGDVALYLSTLLAQDPDTWAALAEVEERKEI